MNLLVWQAPPASAARVRTGQFVVIKLSAADGSEIWCYTIDGGPTPNDLATALSVDADGNAIATGRVGSQLTAAKIAATDGSELWRKIVQGPNPGPTAPFSSAVAVDASGDVVVGGQTGCNSMRLPRAAPAEGRDAQDSRSFRRTGRRRGPISGRFSANATVASMKPTFSPAS